MDKEKRRRRAVFRRCGHADILDVSKRPIGLHDGLAIHRAGLRERWSLIKMSDSQISTATTTKCWKEKKAPTAFCLNIKALKEKESPSVSIGEEKEKKVA